MLFPRSSETRQMMDLCGLWRFKADASSGELHEAWAQKPLFDTQPMAVPASYNDLTNDPALRDHVGWVWYETQFFACPDWKDSSVVLRFGSATHTARVWVNGKPVVEHKGGYLPFEADISQVLDFAGSNRITVALSNMLDWTILPPGDVHVYHDDTHPDGMRVQRYYHDFFNYAGIHRPVKILVLPKDRLEDVRVITRIEKSRALVDFELRGSGKDWGALPKGHEAVLLLLDADGRIVAEATGSSGTLEVSEPKLWEPGKGYLYQLQVSLSLAGKVSDIYRQPVGIRTVEIVGMEFRINGKPFHFKGFGKHEDAPIRGKGADAVTDLRDFQLMEWIGANSFRTSHYPYSEEIMNLADEMGMVVIDESPAVGLWENKQGGAFIEGRVGQVMLEHHLEVMRELIERDKNHPCVVMWSVANEAATWEEGSRPYFEKVAARTRELDPTRPVTIVLHSGPDIDKVGDLFDLLCINRYYSWYGNPGMLQVIEMQLLREFKLWEEKYGKPLIVSEYGADTIAGFHSNPPQMFTEEYQCAFLDRFHKAMDKMPAIIGEHVWNFADFATKQGVTRVMGNKKGVFTRERQPKHAAHLLRKRWAGKEVGEF